MKLKTKNKEIEKAVKIAGGQKKLADLIDIKQPSVWRWANGLGKPSPENVLKIVKVTNGECKAHLMRPDLPNLFPCPEQ